MFSGPAPEIGQAEVRRLLALHPPEPEPEPTAPSSSSKWWILEPSTNKPLLMTAQEIQSLINGAVKDLQVCADGGNAWVLASTQGFSVPGAPPPISTGPEADLGPGISAPKNPLEEKLETYPDQDLFNAAVQRNMLPANLPLDQMDRQSIVRKLAALGVTSL